MKHLTLIIVYNFLLKYFQAIEITESIQKQVHISQENRFHYTSESSDDKEIIHEDNEDFYDTESFDSDKIKSQDGWEESEGERADSEAETSEDSDYRARLSRRLRRQIRQRGLRTASSKTSRGDSSSRPSRLSLYLEKANTDNSEDKEEAKIQPKSKVLETCGIKSTARCALSKSEENQSASCRRREDTKSKRKMNETQDILCHATNTVEQIPCKKTMYDTSKISGTLFSESKV